MNKMKKKTSHIPTQQSYSTAQMNNKQPQKVYSQSQTIKKYHPYHNKNKTVTQINKIKSSHIVNDHLINTLNPKRTSMDLTSFIQVFRKKVRQTTIARQFQNSLQKFKSLSQKRTVSYTRHKGGFVGSYKKQNQLLIQNNKIDQKLKKIIISDFQFRQRKMNPKLNYSQISMVQKQSMQQNFENSLRQKSSHMSRKILPYSKTQLNEQLEHKTISFSSGYYQPNKLQENPQMANKYNQLTPSLYHQKIQNSLQKNSPQKTQQNSKKASSIFTNRRLQTIASYQRPNLMYNLSLYRKKPNFHATKTNKSKFAINNTRQ